MSNLPNVTWTEAATVQSGQRQHSLSGPREITSVMDAGGPQVLVCYADDTNRPYARHEQLPILVDEPKPECTCDWPADVPGVPHRPWCATRHRHPSDECVGLCEPGPGQ